MSTTGYSRSTTRRKINMQVAADLEYIFGSAAGTAQDELVAVHAGGLNKELGLGDSDMDVIDYSNCSEPMQSSVSNQIAVSDVCHDDNDLPFVSCDSEGAVDDIRLDDSDLPPVACDTDSADSCSDAEEPSTCRFQSNIAEQLRDWSMKFDISLVAVAALLSILKFYFPSLPSDPRTLKKTPRKYTVKAMNGQNGVGEYCHLGLAKGLCSIVSTLSSSVPCLQLQFNVDGLPLFKSSSTAVWPILCLLKGVPLVKPFVVGLFCGPGKPQNVAEYLADLISELDELLRNGLFCCGKMYSVCVHSFVCDAPARALIKGTKNHSGYSACEKCTQLGEYDGKVIFPLTDAPLRTDESFDAMTDEYHHSQPCALRILNIGCVSQFGLDYMHMVCLGVMRRLILYWKGPVGPLPVRLGSRSVLQLSQKLLCLVPFVPHEFARKPRSVNEVMRWKATEFRLFLLYVGPVVLHGILPQPLLSHFMLLFVAMRILSSPKFAVEYCDYANKLLHLFVKDAEVLYGREILVYNVHSLIHLAADVKKLGCVDEFSCFPFESMLGRLKKLVRKPQCALQQIVRRLGENSTAALVCCDEKNIPAVKYEHCTGPLLPWLNVRKQYKQLIVRNFLITSSSKNNCIVTTDGRVAIVRNIVEINSDIFLIIEAFTVVGDFFTEPLESSKLGICRVLNSMSDMCCIPVANISDKCFCLPVNDGNEYVVIPLLHTC